MDWYRFCCERLDRQLKAVQDVIKRSDSVHPTSVNPCNVVWQSAGCGQDVFSEGELVDFMGSTAHVAWMSRQLKERNNQYVALLNEVTKAASAHPKGFYYITELQAGTIIFAGSRPFTPTADEITHWLWESIGAGAKGVVYWLYASRESGFEGMEWGLMNLHTKESERSAASKAASDLIYASQDLFDTLVAAPRDAFVLYSHNTQFLGHIEGGWVDPGNVSPANPRNRGLGGDGMAGAFNMLCDLGWSPGIIYEKKVLKTAPPGGILIAPSAYALDREAVAEIESFVSGGGTLICDSFFACKNGWGRVEPANYEAQRRMFGGCIADIQSRFMDDPMPISAGDGSFDGWYLSMELEDSAYEDSRVLARFASGRPAAIESLYGKGRVVYIATIFFQRYFNDPMRGHLDFLSSILPERPAAPVSLLNPGTHMRMKSLASDCGGDGLTILLNHAQSGGAEIKIGGGISLIDMKTGEVFSGGGEGMAVRIPMGEMQVRIFRTRH
jgi:beta-galactosidase